MRRYQTPNSEATLQEQVCTYLKLQYPYVVFMSDMAAGMKLTMGQAIKRKKINSDRGLPDLVILHPVGEQHGLCLELKRAGTVIYKRDGSLRKDEHLEEQQEVLHRLDRLGYAAQFAVGFDQAKLHIDTYFASNL